MSLFMFKRVRGMTKVWKDVDEVIKMVHELPSNKLRETEKEMVSIPKFDKYTNKK